MAGEGRHLEAGGRPVLLKWHKLKREAADPDFTAAGLAAGLAAGCALEVDLVATADGRFVCLHDLTLDRETTGTGPVRAMEAAAIAGLRRRDDTGAVLDEPPLMLEDVVAAVRKNPPPEPLQLDLKEPAAALDDDLVSRFGAALGETAPRFILGAVDWPAAMHLAGAAPGLRLGFDPLGLAELAAPRTATGFEAAGRLMLDAAPEAEMLYLHHPFLLAALDAGVDLVAMCHAAGRRVDCWRLEPEMPDIRARLARVMAAGVDQITTDSPFALEALWQELSTCS